MKLIHQRVIGQPLQLWALNARYSSSLGCFWAETGGFLDPPQNPQTPPLGVPGICGLSHGFGLSREMVEKVPCGALFSPF